MNGCFKFHHNVLRVVRILKPFFRKKMWLCSKQSGQGCVKDIDFREKFFLVYCGNVT